MKGFIEVTRIYTDIKDKEKVLINVNTIANISFYKKANAIEIEFQSNGFMLIAETYEEIKQKIKQATEPKLMIDEKGNLKEQKIRELKKRINRYKSDCKAFPHTNYAKYARERYKELREELKELEDEIHND